MTAFSRLRPLAVLLAGALCIGTSSAHAATPPRRTASAAARGHVAPAPSGSQWLAEINRYRVAAGLAPVHDDPAWDAGLLKHFVYLAETPSKYRTGVYASLHRENPASPWYSAAGATAGGSSDLFSGIPGTPVQTIDGWLESPFHATAILQPNLKTVAFAEAHNYAGLNVLSGFDESAPASSSPVLFPGNGIVTNLAAYQGYELPSPNQGCPASGTWGGLPLIALLPSTPSPKLSATVSGPAGVLSPENRGLCIVDQYTFKTTDKVYGATGAGILVGSHAVFLIPDKPLVGGTYHVSLDVPGAAPITWSFREDQPTFHLRSPIVFAGRPLADPITVTGGVAPFRWSCPTLPAGLSAGSDGVVRGELKGTIRASSSVWVKCSVTDGAGYSFVSDRSLTIVNAQVLPAHPVLQRGGALQQITVEVAPFDATARMSLDGTLPPGMHFVRASALSGILVGTPRVDGTTTLELVLTDGSVTQHERFTVRVTG